MSESAFLAIRTNLCYKKSERGDPVPLSVRAGTAHFYIFRYLITACIIPSRMRITPQFAAALLLNGPAKMMHRSTISEFFMGESHEQ